MKTPLVRWALTMMAATVLQAVTGMALVGDRIASPPGGPGTILAWAFASNGSIAAVLLGLAVRSRWLGRRLMLAIFSVAFGVGYLANLVEAAVFDVLPVAIVLRVLAAGFLTSGVLALMVAGTTRCDKRPADPEAVDGPGPWPVAWRVAVVSLLYLVTYFAAGLLVYPFIAHFYQTLTMPKMRTVVLLQVLVRGPLFAALISLLLRFLIGSRVTRALWAGITMSVLGGIAPLLVPSAIFPDEVRWAHLVEVGVSNFVFGAASAWILSAPVRLTGRARLARQAPGQPNEAGHR